MTWLETKPWELHGTNIIMIDMGLVLKDRVYRCWFWWLGGLKLEPIVEIPR
jgi:hypothetical protein